MNEIQITQENFSNYFRDCRTSKPERDDVIARYSARAEFVEGQLKTDLIDLLANKDKAYAAVQVMRKLGFATEPEAVKICKEICSDLISGLSVEEIEKKPYKYTMESFFYTKKKYIPSDDPHWTAIGIANLEEFLDKYNNPLEITSKIVEQTEATS